MWPDPYRRTADDTAMLLALYRALEGALRAALATKIHHLMGRASHQARIIMQRTLAGAELVIERGPETYFVPRMTF
jgi:hypothetical protein